LSGALLRRQAGRLRLWRQDRAPASETRRQGKRESGGAAYYTPYGKQPMREWIEIALEPSQLFALDDLIATALEFAERNNR
jgi:hypothetical protein